MNPDGLEVLSFDSYGTLVDWETGLLAALRPVLVRHRVPWSDEEVLTRFAHAEAEIQRAKFRSYREVLREVAGVLAEQGGWPPSEAERTLLEESLPDWPLFPDTKPGLRALKSRFRLAVVSNIDDDLFAATARRLGVVFDEVITAQQAGAYKPALPPFAELLRRVAVPKERLLHVAQSRYHDIAPAGRLGLRTVWLNRRRGRAGDGAVLADEARPDFETPDLRSLVEWLGCPAAEFAQASGGE